MHLMFQNALSTKVSQFYDDAEIFLLEKVLKQLRKNEFIVLPSAFSRDIETRKFARVMDTLIFLLRGEEKYDDPAISSVSSTSLIR